MPSAGKTDSRDSIKSKAFEEEGVGFGEGEEKLSGEGGEPPTLLLPLPKFPYTPSFPATSRHTASTSMSTMQR